MSHNEFTIRELIEPQEASPMKHEMNGLPCKFLARGSHVHVSGCPQGTWQLCRKVAFWRQNPKIGSRKINDLGASTFLFSVMCDRALRPRQHSNRGKFLGRFTNRPNLLQYECTGCEFSVAQELLAWAKVKGTSGVREWCRQTKGWNSEAERETSMHVIKRFPTR